MPIIAQNNKMEIKYPETRKDNAIDTYFGEKVADPYRWLEDDLSAETEAWVKSQNKVTFDYLSQIPYREDIKKRLTELWNYEKFTAPFKEGDYYYFYKNDGLQNQYVLYRQKENGDPEVFLDPNTFSKDATTSLSSISFSENGMLAAYAISEGGSDWRKVIVIDAMTKKQVGDTLRDVKFSGVSWFKNDGFYYSSYDKPKGSELSAKTDQHKLYFHKLGTDQKEDKVIFGDELKRRYVGGYVTENQKYLIITAAISTSGNELYYADLTTADKTIKPLVTNVENDYNVVEADDKALYIYTNHNA
ncbi:MAG: S9 family peptidase, partial [Lutimonas sp.]